MDIYWIWLSQTKYIGAVLQRRLIDQFGSPEKIYCASDSELRQIPRISQRAINSLLHNRDLSKAKQILKQCDSQGIQLLTLFDNRYPNYVKKFHDAPILFYYKGLLKNLSETVGVVGSRRCSAYGRTIAEKIGMELALHDITLVSGFAKGIDSYAQASCLHHAGYVVIFLAGGVDVCYPSEQRNLYEATLNNGGVFLSEHPPGIKPFYKYFVKRNLFISGWSRKLVVVEAGEKSGALSTADFAQKQGKPVYVVPHQIDSLEGKGSNRLLLNGASPYLGIDSIVSFREELNYSIQVQKIGDPILQLLSTFPQSIYSIAQALQLDEQTIMDKLITLELEGRIIIRGNQVSLL